jgi:capsular polysaccharide biosynthesis protein
MKVIFHIEHRGPQFIFHWFIYMLSGLRYLGTNNSRWGQDSNPKNRFEQNVGFNIPIPSKPYLLYIPILPEPLISYQKETFEILKDEFKLISKEDINKEDIVINNYGEHILNTDYHISPEGYTYLRNLFLSKILMTGEFKGKKYYLSRNRSHLLEGNAQDGNIKRRQILNDQELSKELLKEGIETIFLEDYPLDKKIQIFNEAEMIISPNSGGLTFTLFSNLSSIIVEINTNKPYQISRQYEDQCRFFNVKYKRYCCNNYDDYNNMTINVEDFMLFLGSS